MLCVGDVFNLAAGFGSAAVRRPLSLLITVVYSDSLGGGGTRPLLLSVDNQA